jgi:transcriptional regulator with XRE-family HTH domain
MTATPIEVLSTPTARVALANHDLATVYSLLNVAGYSQRRLAGLVGQRQSEVAKVIAGHQVRTYDVLTRIADGLGVPRGWMGLAFDDETARLFADNG